ncbi:hypothetical protein B0H13DRAFT_2351746 [Mycena leptocephala]|nr:hypothetical protein B0H13DRAFT_2351746 [Mycena leptocephala]
MSSASPPNARASMFSQKKRGITLRPLKSSTSHSDWLVVSIHTARILKESAELVPVPYVKGVIGTVIILLETVEKVKRNRDDLKELCDSTMVIVAILKDQLSSHPNTPAVTLKELCEELERQVL